MPSNIDPSKPTAGQATTQSVRDNFQAAKDEIEALQPGGGQSFADYLAGYLNTGLHGSYTDDLDDIAVNSTYSILASTVTNEPVDFISNGFIHTYLYYSNDLFRTQILYGMDVSMQYKIWMRHRENGPWGAWVKVVDGNLLSLPLPTSDPLVSGALWNNAGVVNVSA